MKITAKFLMIAALAVAFASCGKDNGPDGPDNPDAVKVTGVTLNKTATTIAVGGTETLTPTVAPADADNKNVTWSSDKTAIATVDNAGKVTGVSAGTATITVKTTDGSKTATCAVTVSATTVPVTGVTLNKSTTTIEVGGTETLVPTIAPVGATNQNVTWSSDKTDIATVGTDGKVTGIKVGTATITVKTVDGDKTATCAVTVSATTVSVTGVSLNKTETSIAVDAFEILTPTITPEGATNQNVTWGSDKTDIATVDASGKVTGVKAGTATITVTTEDGGKTATCAVTVTAAPGGKTVSVGTQDRELLEKKYALTIFPVTTTGIEDGWYNISYENLPTGTTPYASMNITDNHGTITINGSPESEAGVYTNLKLIVDGVTSAPFTLTISAAPVRTVAVGTQSGTLRAGVTGAITFPVTTTNYDNGSYQLVVNNPPPGLYASDNRIEINNNSATLTIEGYSQSVEGVYTTPTITIRTSSSDPGATSEPFTITVGQGDIAVTGVTLNENVFTLEETFSATLQATVLPTDATNQAVTWSSSNASVASVDAMGKVTAITVGTSTITATTQDGGKQASCAVTVVQIKYSVVINGVEWATRNVGAPGYFADSPESYGMFYQWNRSKGWPATGTVTGWDSSTPTGDTWAAANVPCPTGWRLPTEAEFETLFYASKVSGAWTTSKGVNGYRFTDIATGASIFLPAAGYRDYGDGSLGSVGSRGYYWSASSHSTGRAWNLSFIDGLAGQYGYYRSNGFTVRCVRQ